MFITETAGVGTTDPRILRSSRDANTPDWEDSDPRIY
jgi:hypothetical protein